MPGATAHGRGSVRWHPAGGGYFTRLSAFHERSFQRIEQRFTPPARALKRLSRDTHLALDAVPSLLLGRCYC